MYAYSDLYYDLEILDERIESEMHKISEKTLARLSHKFVHSPVSIKQLLLTIAYGYFDSNEHAINVANQLDLCKLDFLAIAEDFEGFKEEYLKEYERAENF